LLTLEEFGARQHAALRERLYQDAANWYFRPVVAAEG
jgi:hypothetical protein